VSARWVLAVLFVAAAVLVGVEFAKGAAHAGRVHLADPCKPRAFTGDDPDYELVVCARATLEP